MTTDLRTPQILAPLGALIGEAVGALGASASVPVAAAVGDLDPAASAAYRSDLGGAGALVTVLPAAAAGEEGEAAALVDPLVAAFAEQLSGATGRPIEPAGAQPTPIPADAAAVVVAFEISGAQGAPLVVHWVLEPPLVTLLEGDPVTPSAGDASVAPASFPELDGTAASGPAQDLALLAEVTMEVTVELGRTQMPVRELLGLGEGSIVELDRAADTAVSVLVNGTLIARGDVVVIGDELGVRITEVITRP